MTKFKLKLLVSSILLLSVILLFKDNIKNTLQSFDYFFFKNLNDSEILENDNLAQDAETTMNLSETNTTTEIEQNSDNDNSESDKESNLELKSSSLTSQQQNLIQTNKNLAIEKIHLVCELIKMLGDLEIAIITEDQEAFNILKNVQDLVSDTEFEYDINPLENEISEYFNSIPDMNSKEPSQVDNYFMNLLSYFMKIEYIKQDDDESSNNRESPIIMIKEIKNKLSNKNTIKELLNGQ